VPANFYSSQICAVNGKHLFADQTLCIANLEHLLKQGLKLLCQFANEFGNVGVARGAVAAQGDESRIRLSRALTSAQK
jgi:hypothetical protein